MADGAIGYHRPENIRRISVEKNGPIVREIEKTRVERNPDLAQEQMDREREIQALKKKHFKEVSKAKAVENAERQQEKEARSYDNMMHEGNITSNSEVKATADSSAAEEYEDDFF
jgi:hypothetical protein